MATVPATLGRITPAVRVVPAPSVPAPPAPRVLTSREKAAIIVRLMLAQGQKLPITSLPEHMQSALAEQMGHMRLVDRSTLSAVVQEFLGALEDIGLTFPGGIEGALSLMDGHISGTAASRLRRLAGASSKSDPWDHLCALDNERLLPVLEEESIEVAAVMLSKLPVPKAAELLGKLPGERARRVAYAVSQTAHVDPETVRRIGLALSSQLESLPPKAFEAGPVERVGAILNISGQLTRDEVLAGLEEADRGFADLVRKAIFTFGHIPERLGARDVPKVARAVDQPVLVTALAAALANPGMAPAAEHMLANMSQRLAQALREEVTTRGKVKDREGEEAMNAIILAIRQLEGAGELALIREDDG
jgi:flagellar motor switch protein FliG